MDNSQESSATTPNMSGHHVIRSCDDHSLSVVSCWSEVDPVVVG